MIREPYKYFDYYKFEDADIFFGREEEVHKFVGEILSTRLLVLFSPSGSGKTSLINAGVRPQLEKLGYHTVYTRLEDDPIPSVLNAIQYDLSIRLNISIDGHNNDMHGCLEAITQKLEKPLIIFLDQFEEFFIVFRNNPEMRQTFIEQLAEVRYDERLPVSIVLSLREEYFANLHEFRDAIPSIFQNNANIRLESFTEEQARLAIEEPAKVVGFNYQDGLAEKIASDLRNGNAGIEPIRLQIVCYNLWHKRSASEEQKITFEDYENLGGAKKIIRDDLSENLKKIPWQQQRLAERIFEALKTPDNTKRYRPFEDLQGALKVKNSGHLKKVLYKLLEINILRQEKSKGTDWFEFKHDYLVPQINQWLQREKERRNRNKTLFLEYILGFIFLILLGSLLYMSYAYTSFYAGFINPKYEWQKEEVAIFRGVRVDRFKLGDFFTTGLFLEDVGPEYKAKYELKNKLIIGRGNKINWESFADRIESTKGGVFLYRLGLTNRGINTLSQVLKKGDSSAASALGELGRSDDRVIDVLIEALKSYDVRIAAKALGELGRSDDKVIDILIEALNDYKEDIRSKAAIALGELLRHKKEDELIEFISDQRSGYRTAGAQALVRKDKISLDKVNPLKDEDKNPWIRLGAWEAYQLIQERRNAEKKAEELLKKADNYFSSNEFFKAATYFESTFNILINNEITNDIHSNKVKAAFAKFMQAKSEAKLNKINKSVRSLETAFEYNPDLRKTLKSQLPSKENDWSMLQDNPKFKELEF